MLLVGRELSQSTAFFYSLQHIYSRYVERIAGISCEIYIFERKFLFSSFPVLSEYCFTICYFYLVYINSINLE